jgi:putative methyltransferase (TIGR04325 family)
LICQKCLIASLKVRGGEAIYERDGALFYDNEQEGGLVAAMLNVKELSGSLSVIDFGGSFGTTFLRHKKYLCEVGLVAWDIVEQPHFVQAARTHFTKDLDEYFESVAEAESKRRHNVILASNVIQYLEHGLDLVSEWSRLLPFVVLNNVPLHEQEDLILVQSVPPSMYSATYPVRFFNRAQFMERIEKDFRVVRLYASEAIWPVNGKYVPSTGMLLESKGVQ